MLFFSPPSRIGLAIAFPIQPMFENVMGQSISGQKTLLTTFATFRMNKLLVAHLRDPDLVVQPSGHRDAKSAVVVPAVDVKAIAPPGEPTYVSDESGEEGY